MTFIYILIAGYIAWIWIDYFRIIDIFEKEKTALLISALCIGFFSIPIVFLFHSLGWGYGLVFPTNNVFFNLLDCILNIGLVEEVAKIAPALVFYSLNKKRFNEPVDFVIFFSLCALGFSAIENVLYFKENGASIFILRGILCSVGHMFFSAITAYGILEWKVRKSPKGIFILVKYFSLGVLAHGLYDFFLMETSIQPWGYFMNLALFFVLVSVFATVLNNALNISPFFSYSKVINGRLLGLRLLYYYLGLFGVQCLILQFVYKDLVFATFFNWNLLVTALIVWITVSRLSRFKLIWQRWEKIQFKLPFAFTRTSYFETNQKGYHISGDSWNEAEVNQHYQKSVYLYFMSDTSGKQTKVCKIINKIHDKFDDPIFVAQISSIANPQQNEIFYLIAKNGKPSLVAGQFPILGLLSASDDLDIISRNVADVKFIAWVYLRN